MKFIFLNHNGETTPNKLDKSVDLSKLQYLQATAGCHCCRIADPILGKINFAIKLNYVSGIAKFVVNNYEIHSLVKFNQAEKNKIKNFFRKYT